MNKTAFLKTTTLVSAISLLERGLGFLYRIILSRTIGAEGVGMYQLAFSVFALFMTLAASGIPVTVSRLLAKHRARGNAEAERQTVSAAVFLTLIFAVPLFIGLYAGHSCLAFLFSDRRCEQVFLILLYGFVFNAVYSVFRGSFWGNKDFFPYSALEFFEEVVMVVVGSFLVMRATDPFDGAKRAAFALALSYIVSFTAAALTFFCKGGRLANPKPQLRPLLLSALPITAMRTSTSLVSSLVSVLLPAGLIASGLSAAEAMSRYGTVMGMAFPVLYAPATVIGSIALVLTPELSESYYRKDYTELKNNVEKPLRVSALIACLLTPLLFVYGRDIGLALFDTELSGELIRAGSFLLLPMSLNLLSASMLNSLHCEKQTLLIFFLGSAVLLLCVWLLPPLVGVYALLIGEVGETALCSVLSLFLLKKKCPAKPAYFLYFLKGILLSAVGCAVGTLLLYASRQIFGDLPALLTSSFTLIVFLTAGAFLLKLCSPNVFTHFTKKARRNAVKSV